MMMSAERGAAGIGGVCKYSCPIKRDRPSPSIQPPLFGRSQCPFIERTYPEPPALTHCLQWLPACIQVRHLCTRLPTSRQYQTSPPQLREEFLIIPQVVNAETDETGFGGFVTMPLGIFVEISGANSKTIQYQTRALPKRNYYVHIHIAVTNLPKV